MEQQQAQRIFVQLVRPGEGTEDTRRLATRAEIGEDNWNLVQELAGESARLVVTGMNEATGEETVEVVHEALIREWQNLREWMERKRDFRTWQERLRVVIRQWEAMGKKERALLTGFPLDEAADWLQQRPADMSVPERDFIKLSVTLREKEIKERESQQQRITVARTTAICFGIVGVTLIILLNRQSIITVVIVANKQHLSESHLLKKLYLPRADLSGANLWKANLSQADLTEANLSRANLQSAYLLKTYMPRANLSQSDLSQANLSEAYIDQADLSGANLQGANFVKTYMTKANLLKAELLQTNLSEANIDGADLSGANLQGAKLVKTFMPGSNLQDADLSQANLLEANIDRADLSGANFKEAKNLNPDQVKRAKNWEKAKYDEDFSKKLGLKGSK